MKFLAKLVVSIVALLIGVYYASFYVMPSITIVNDSGVLIKQVRVTLPDSHLDFGAIDKHQVNTLHYDLTQNDGVYHYQINFTEADWFKGSCGYITNNEIHKRVVVTIDQHKEVRCN
jgi:hypothetical protein